jgi:hypothetical protein
MNQEEDIGINSLYKHCSEDEIKEAHEMSRKYYNKPEIMDFALPFKMTAGNLDDNVYLI